ATNKCLAQSDKSYTAGEATKKREAAGACPGEVSTSMRDTTSEDQRNCRSDGWQYGLVSQHLVCAFDYAMRRSRWMHVQGLSSAISHARRTLQMSHVPNNDDL